VYDQCRAFLPAYLLKTFFDKMPKELEDAARYRRLFENRNLVACSLTAGQAVLAVVIVLMLWPYGMNIF